MPRMKPLLLLLLFVAVSGASALAQLPADPQSQKLTEIGDTNADTEMAHLDLMAVALAKNPESRGYVIAYSDARTPPGSFLMRIYGYRDYLVNTRGIDSNRFEIVEGGVKDKISTEFWLVPNGAKPPSPDSEFELVPKLPIKFDVVYPECPPEMTVSLYELKDGLVFYARALQKNPNTTAKIVVYPGRRTTLRKAAKMASETKRLLVKNQKVSANRILATSRGRRRTCSQIELWIM